MARPHVWITYALQRASRRRQCEAAGEKLPVTCQVDPLVRLQLMLGRSLLLIAFVALGRHVMHF